ncbi:MAG: c-type cytochrome [Chloroflexi bacterium]|nr:c-type cytochrome [Chloroflexota bacterium]
MNLQRLLVERIEHRIIAGTVAFLAIMVLVGWLAINENGRMTAFARMYEARAVERGAELFVANCTTCHGPDGRGLTGVAPGLNSPLMFGFDFLPEYHRELGSLNLETVGLNAERDLETTTAERVAEIDARLAEIDARKAAMEQEIAPVVQQMQTAIDRGYDPDVFSRLQMVDWQGSLNSFVFTTLVHGRPTSGSYWPGPMVSWSKTTGGPLRDDQLEDLTAFIMNWDKGSEWTVEDLMAVNQFPKEPADPALVTALPGDVPLIGANTATRDVVANLEGLVGDPQNGQTLYNGALACSGCHLNAAVAPQTEGTFTRVNEVRLADPALAGYTAEQYFAESITHPNAYVSPGYVAGLMPQNFGDRLTYQDLADLIAYLSTQDQPVS